MTWLKNFWCDVRSVSYDFRKKTGTLGMAPYHCCNMSACIAFFCRIDPAVKRIDTFSGKVPDTIYCRSGKEWKAFMPRQVKPNKALASIAASGSMPDTHAERAVRD